MSEKAVILLSGGLDSATAAAIARADGFELYALSIDYGQRHRFELEAAAKVAAALGVKRHVTLRIDLTQFGGSALTAAIDVPKARSREEMEAGIPITYVPARNTVFLSLALGYAEVLGAADIFMGVNAIDYSGYPDCRPEFIAAFERLANLATKAGVEGLAAIQDPYSTHSHDQGPNHSPRHRTWRRLRPDPQLLRSRSGRSTLRRVRLVPAAPPRFCRSGHRRSVGHSVGGRNGWSEWMTNSQGLLLAPDPRPRLT